MASGHTAADAVDPHLKRPSTQTDRRNLANASWQIRPKRAETRPDLVTECNLSSATQKTYRVIYG